MFWDPVWEHKTRQPVGSSDDETPDPFPTVTGHLTNTIGGNESEREDYYYGEAFKQWVTEHAPRFLARCQGLPLWRMNPHNFVRLCNNGTMDSQSSVARAALRGIHDLIQIRRTMASEVDVFGEHEKMGQKIPHAQVSWVELGWGEHDGTTASQLDLLSKELYDRYMPLLSKDGTAPAAKSARPVPQPEGLRDSRIHRRLTMFAENLRWGRAMCRITPDADGVVLSASRIYEMMGQPGHGIEEYFHLTKELQTSPIPQTRQGAVEALCEASMKLPYLCKLFYECIYGSDEEVRGKLIVMCGWAHEQLRVMQLCNMLGLKYLFISANMDQKLRDRVIDLWNSPAQKHAVLILNWRLSGQGVNLHKDCHQMAVTGPVDNVANGMQFIGRVLRQGQEKEPRITFITQRHSYDDYTSAAFTRKYLAQMCGESAMHDVTKNPEHLLELNRQLVKKYVDLGMEIVEPKDADLGNEWLALQADRHIMHMFGMRSSRRYWNMKDPYAIDVIDSPTAQGKIRAVLPIEVAEWDVKHDRRAGKHSGMSMSLLERSPRECRLPWGRNHTQNFCPMSWIYTLR